MSVKFDSRLNDVNRRMQAAVDVLNNEFAGIRAGRAHASLLDPVRVDVYGALMPLNQLATVSAPEPRLISVQVWDRSQVKAVEKAIIEANLGLNPQAEGQLIRIPLPHLTEERRKELAKLASKYTEDAKISVRNIRRDAIEALKKQEKDKELSEDELHRLTDDVQKLTDHHIKKMDEGLELKQKDIMQV
ncbi:MAG: ribosome recycling factor [Proteobacteria bacterium]|nr:ribosome recycling factor [Pseudomonadota bacterium]